MGGVVMIFFVWMNEWIIPHVLNTFMEHHSVRQVLPGISVTSLCGNAINEEAKPSTETPL